MVVEGEEVSAGQDSSKIQVTKALVIHVEIIITVSVIGKLEYASHVGKRDTCCKIVLYEGILLLAIDHVIYVGDKGT